MEVCHARPMSVPRAICRRKKAQAPTSSSPAGEGLGVPASVSQVSRGTLTSVFYAGLLVYLEEAAVFWYLLRSQHLKVLMDLTFHSLPLNRWFLFFFLPPHLLINVLACPCPQPCPCSASDVTPWWRSLCGCWWRPSLGKGPGPAGTVPAVASSLHEPAVVGMLSAAQIASSLITGHNEVFVILKGKEETRLRIVWEDDCVVPQVQGQEDYNG